MFVNKDNFDLIQIKFDINKDNFDLIQIKFDLNQILYPGNIWGLSMSNHIIAWISTAI